MKHKSLSDTLKILSEAPGISGNESLVAKVVKDLSEPFVDEITTDKIGSLITKSGNKGPKIMIGGHLDEIGLMVTKITNEGFIKFQTVGSWLSQVMLAQKWHIYTAKGIVLGITGAQPPHMIPIDQRSKSVEITSMYLDIGVTSYQEAIDLGIEPGNMIVPATSYEVLANPDYVAGKAFDNRVGSLIVLEVLKRLKPTNKQVYGVHTVQEEVGLRGAKTVSYMVKPDIAIAVDVGVGNDMPGGDADQHTLGKGPQIALYDARLIGHPKLRNLVKQVALAHNLPYQEIHLVRGATDAGEFSLAHEGVPSLAICVPMRYMHSHTGIVNLADIETTILLILAIIEALNPKIIADITY